jgi:hypothetical protein
MVRLGCTEYSNYEVYETFCKKSIVYEKLNMFKLIPHVLMNTYSNIMLCKLKLLHFFNEKSLNSYFSNIDTVNFYNIYLECFSIGFLVSKYSQLDCFLVNRLFTDFLNIEKIDSYQIYRINLSLQSLNKMMVGLPDIYNRLILFSVSNKRKIIDMIDPIILLLDTIISTDNKNRAINNYDISISVNEICSILIDKIKLFEKQERDTLYIFIEESLIRMYDRSLYYYSTNISNLSILDNKNTLKTLFSYDEMMIDSLFNYKYKSLGNEDQDIFKDINKINDMGIYDAYVFLFKKYRTLTEKYIHYINAASSDNKIVNELFDKTAYQEIIRLVEKMIRLLYGLNTIYKDIRRAKQMLVYCAYNLSKINIKIIKVQKHIEQSPLKLLQRYRKGIDYKDEKLNEQTLIELAPIINKNTEEYINQLMSGLRIPGPLWSSNIKINEEPAIVEAMKLYDIMNNNDIVSQKMMGFNKIYI